MALEADSIAEKYEAVSMRYTTLLTLAYVYLKNNQYEKALHNLRAAMRIARQEKYYQTMWWWYSPMMTSLMEIAIRENIEKDHALQIVKRLKLKPHDPISAPEEWPWEIKIITLGEFKIEVGDKPLTFGRKINNKILDVLKLIITNGGSASAEILLDALWPDLDGDKAYHALSTALYRLRKLFQHDELLQLKDKLIVLEPGKCYVDSLSFTALVNKAKKALKKGDKEIFVMVMEQALRIYNGTFLPGESEFMIISSQEKFKNIYLNSLELLAELYETENKYEKSLELYIKGFNTDELAESVCRGLIRNCLSLGRRNEAITFYKRHELALKRLLNQTPDLQTLQLIDGMV